MSDEFETISVVETEPVEVASAEPVMADAPEPTPAPEPVAEQPDADQRVFDNNPKIGSSEDNIKQDVAAENGTALDNGGSEGRAPVTARGREEAETKKQEARADLIEQMAQAEARRDFLNKDHDFGGMKMSGADLEKMMNFISNPAMQEKLRERLGKSGVPKEKVDKGMTELNEYIELKKKEKEGKLTEEQQQRLKEINKSEEFKVVAQGAERVAREQGVQFSKEHMQEMIKTRGATELAESNNGQAVKNMQAQSGSLTSNQYKETAVALGEPEPSTKPVAYVAASARDELPPTVVLKDKFAATANPVPIAATSEPALDLGGNAPVSLAATANNNVIVARAQPATVVASL